ncbi:MAG: trimethylamine methyltransferase family protein [Desulfobacterales bacterium]|nr:trimethylamine methyltransferase family protein [Desulfobacterales bacterium]
MFSKTPDIIGFKSPLRGEFLTRTQIDTLKNGTLSLLDEVGVCFPSQRVLQIFADNGARVDMDTGVIRISPDLVLKAMSTAPRSFVLAGREERFDLVLDGQCSYLCTEGCGVHVIDPHSRQKRSSCKEDVERSARISDALPLIGFYWPMVTSQDCGITAQLHDCYAGLTNTLKHVRGGTTVPPYLARYIVEMATIVAGNTDSLKSRPPVNANICTISPLSHDAHGIESALIYAEAGIPVSFFSMPIMGSTAPAAPFGALIMGDAEVVSAMTLIQLAFPGAPVFHAVHVAMMDPYTGGYIGVNSAPTKIISTQLAHAWGVPSLGAGGVNTDAPDNGWQSGMEGGLGSAFIPLTAAEIGGHMGMTEGAMTFSPEKLILDHEICWRAYDELHGLDSDGIDMALDVINKVGPGGHFLTERHTINHLRDFRLSPLLRKKNDDGSFRDPFEIALEEFKRIDEFHHPEPLPEKVLTELDRILASADCEAKRSDK